MTKQRIIGIHGKARSGKDTFAKLLDKALKVETSFYHFADPIYEMIETLVGSLPTHLDHNGIVQYDKKSIAHPYGKSLRYMLQTLGTEWGRNLINKDIWVLQAEKFVKDNNGEAGQIIFPDVRFANEAAFIRRIGGVVVHITRPHTEGIDNGAHSSEDVLGIDYVDSRVFNNRSLTELQSIANFVHRNYDQTLATRKHYPTDAA